MFQRSTVIAALVGVEIVLLISMVRSLHGSGSAYAHSWSSGHSSTGTQSRTMASGSTPIVIIDAPIDDLIVTAHDASTVSLSAPGSDHVSLRHVGNTFHVESDPALREPRFGFMSSSGTISVVVPPSARVTVEHATSSDISVSGLRDALTITTTSGDVHVRDQQGDLAIATTSGDVRLDTVKAPALSLQTTNGDVILARVSARTFTGSTTSGDVHGKALDLHDGRFSTTNGEIVFAMSRETDANFDVKTVSGDVTLTNISATGDDHTKSARIGDGTGAFSLQTTSGDISMTAEGN